MIFVTGATGKVGRHVVTGLTDRGAQVRALLRDPGAADLPAAADVTPADLSEPQALAAHLDGVQAVFLVWPFFSAEEADQIRDAGVVRWPYGDAARSLIHERDIADVAVRALTEDGHSGRRYVLTGPRALTQTEQVREIGVAIGRAVCWHELSREDARARAGRAVAHHGTRHLGGFRRDARDRHRDRA